MKGILENEAASWPLRFSLNGLLRCFSAEGNAVVKVAIRHKRCPATGFPPLFRSLSCPSLELLQKRLTVTFSFEKVVLFLVDNAIRPSEG
jgi:hypothetical protein